MSMIERYRKRGGFVQLLNLIETTSGPKQEKFLKLIADESPAWEAEVRKKMLTLERMATWPTNFLMEFLPQIPAMAIGLAIHPLPADKREAFMKALSHMEKKKVEEFLNEKKPTAGEVAASQVRIINEVRASVSTGRLKFDKFDAALAIPEDIEEQLASGGGFSIPVSDKEVAQHFDAVPAGVPANLSEELTLLRKKVVQLMQDNTRLQQQNTEMKDKLEAIRKIA